MKISQILSNYNLTQQKTLLSFVSIFAVAGPIIVVSAGFWDAISHLLQEPEFFWSTPHIVVYSGVSITTCGAIVGGFLLSKNPSNRFLKIGLKLVIIGAIIQIISGFGDSLSHDLFGIDGLISWSHQPLELGLVLASLGSVFIIKTQKTKLVLFLPLSIIAFLFFTIWLGFNLVLIFGHTIQCIPVYEIFSSGCSIL